MSAVDQGNTSEEFRRDCLARWVMRQRHEVQIRWAKRQSVALRDDIRKRISRMKRGTHGN